jgi:hypothetical protein
MPGGVIMYLHGGAFTLGSCSYQLPTVAVVVATTGVPVVCVEYRLAPEHPFPASLDDIFAAYKGLLGKGYSPGNILLVGDSAGEARRLGGCWRGGVLGFMSESRRCRCTACHTAGCEHDMHVRCSTSPCAAACTTP